MSTAEIRRAAMVLRDRSGFAGPILDPWTPEAITRWACDEAYVGEADQRFADYVSTIRPEVGLAVAKWLDHSARQLGGFEPSESHPALIVARLINGGAA